MTTECKCRTRQIFDGAVCRAQKSAPVFDKQRRAGCLAVAYFPIRWRSPLLARSIIPFAIDLALGDGPAFIASINLRARLPF